MNSVYLVIGRTGEYSDHHEWAVAAYPDRQVAEMHARLANLYLVGAARELDEEWDEEKGKSKLDIYLEACPWDPGASCLYRNDLSGIHPDQASKYTYLTYIVVEVPFRLHPDEYLEKK